MDELLSCPFCGGDAELDTQQHYTYFGAGQYRSGTRIAVYCRECSADMGVCREDVPDIEPEYVIGLWNKRRFPMVKRATGRIIPDLTGIEHVCNWQRAVKSPPPVVPTATPVAASAEPEGGK